MGFHRQGVTTAMLLSLTIMGCSKSAKLNRRCKAGDGSACAGLASLYAAGLGVPRDEARTAQLSQRAAQLQQLACDNAQAGACFALAEMYERARAVPENRVRATELYGKACDAGHGTSCLRLGWQLGGKNSTDRDRPLRLHMSSVPANPVGASAWRVAESRRPVDTRTNAPRAADLFRRACDGGNSLGCVEYGDMCKSGTGVPRDEAQALRLFEKACADGESAGCLLASNILTSGWSPANPDKGQRLIQQGLRRDRDENARRLKACDEGDAIVCYELASARVGSTPGKSGREPTSVELFQKGCDRGDAPSCFRVARALSSGRDVPRDMDKATQLLRKTCDAGYWEACLYLGRMYSDGREGIPQDAAKAAELFQRSCDGHEPIGCIVLAFMYLRSDGVPRDPDKARQLLQTACDAGYGEACRLCQMPATLEDPAFAGIPDAGTFVARDSATP
jgi:uncharacterized protein